MGKDLLNRSQEGIRGDEYIDESVRLLKILKRRD
jgi:hypothetical protein